MTKNVKPIGARFTGDLARLLEERGIGQDILETRCRDDINEFVAWLTSPKKIGKRKLPTTRQTSLVRNSLRRGLRRSLQKEFYEKLMEQTEREILEELAVVKNCVSVREAWIYFSQTGDIPALCTYDYEQIFDSLHTKQEYEPDEELKKEMCALSLTDHLMNPVLERDAYGHRYAIQPYFFVRTVISHRKGHTTWSDASHTLEPISIVFTTENWGKIPEMVNRLVERLNGLKNTPGNQEIEETLLKPLKDVFQLDNATIHELVDALTLLVAGTWRSELEEAIKSAITRLKDVLGSLPNPKDVRCVNAVRRVVEIFESDPEKPSTSIQTLEDATILEHIQKCYGPCEILRRCTTTTLDYAVVRKWSDKSDGYVREAVKSAKIYLAHQKTK